MGRKVMINNKKKYTITDYTKRQAKKLGVIVKPSHKPNKKIDVIDPKNRDKVLASIGGVKSDGSFYNDYPTYMITKGKSYADKKRANYLQRHAHEPKRKVKKLVNGYKSESKRSIYSFTPSYFADKLLW